MLKSKKAVFVPVVLSVLYVVVIGLGGLALNAHTSSLRPQSTPQAQVKSAQSTTVSIQLQPHAPLTAMTVNGEPVNINNPKLELIVMNRGKKPIRAYAIRYDTISAGSESSGLELTNKESQSSLLQPGKSEKIEVAGDGYQADPIKRIQVSVDFVEFDDGTTWGLDTFKSADRLDGLRAGARATTSRLRKILTVSGPSAVLAALETESLEVSPPSYRSGVWVDGFRDGVNLVKARLKHDPGIQNADGIDSALRRPIDASERRLQ